MKRNALFWLFAAYNLNSKGLYYQKPTDYHRGASPKGSLPLMRAVQGCLGLFRGLLTCKIIPFFKVHTLCRYDSTRALKGYPKAKNTTMVKLIHPHSRVLHSSEHASNARRKCSLCSVITAEKFLT